MLVLLFVAFVVYSARRFVLCLTLCHFVLVFFSPFSIAITSFGEERANLCAFRSFVRFVLVWICRFPLPLGVWEGLRFVIVALPGLFSYLFFSSLNIQCFHSTSTVLSLPNQGNPLFLVHLPNYNPVSLPLSIYTPNQLTFTEQFFFTETLFLALIYDAGYIYLVCHPRKLD